MMMLLYTMKLLNNWIGCWILMVLLGLQTMQTYAFSSYYYSYGLTHARFASKPPMARTNIQSLYQSRSIDDFDASGRMLNPVLALTSTLAKLDRQIRRNRINAPYRWTKLVLVDKDDTNGNTVTEQRDEGETEDEKQPASWFEVTPPPSAPPPPMIEIPNSPAEAVAQAAAAGAQAAAAARTAAAAAAKQAAAGTAAATAAAQAAAAAAAATAAQAVTSQLDEKVVYLLEPPNVTPSCIVVFVGGAGLGSYPHVAYNELLTRLSDRLNAAVLTAPYSVGLDHFALAKETGEKARRALLHLQDDPRRLYPSNIPVYCVAHSLGCKLATIYLAATNQWFDGIGLISFNNFGFGQTIGMAKEFAQSIQDAMRSSSSSPSGPRSALSDDLFGQIFTFAESALGVMGIEFAPTPSELERIIQLKFTTERQARTRLFNFDQDKLQNTDDFVRACREADIGADNGRKAGAPMITTLPGTHLTPVYFQLGVDQLPVEGSAREMAREALGGLDSASFGNEQELETLVEELCRWILGKGPTVPLLASTDEIPQLTGGTT